MTWTAIALPFVLRVVFLAVQDTESSSVTLLSTGSSGPDEGWRWSAT